MALPHVTLLLPWAAATYVIFLVLSKVTTSFRIARRAKQLGCTEPVVQKNKWPLGIDNLLRAIAADKEKLFPVDSIKRTIENGGITYKYSILGSRSFFTADEKNVQGLLPSLCLYFCLLMLNSYSRDSIPRFRSGTESKRQLLATAGEWDLHTGRGGMGAFSSDDAATIRPRSSLGLGLRGETRSEHDASTQHFPKSRQLDRRG